MKFANSGPISRIVLACVDTIPDKQQINMISDIEAEVSCANEILRTKISQLKDMTQRRAMYVKFVCDPRDNNLAIMIFKSSLRHDIRVTIPITKTNEEYYQNKSLYELCISHLINIKICNNNEICAHESGGIQINTKISNISKILIAIGLDISMSYALYGFENIKNNIDYIHEYSKLKAQFVHNSQYKTIFDTAPNDTDYSSIAFITDDILTYIGIWTDFIKTLKSHKNGIIQSLDLPIRKRRVQTNASSAILNIFGNHRHIGELPLNKLDKEYKALPSGKFVLVRQMKRASNKDKFSGIEQLINGQPKIGKIRIIELSELFRYNKFSHLFHFYYFEK